MCLVGRGESLGHPPHSAWSPLRAGSPWAFPESWADTGLAVQLQTPRCFAWPWELNPLLFPERGSFSLLSRKKKSTPLQSSQKMLISFFFLPDTVCVYFFLRKDESVDFSLKSGLLRSN